MSRKFVSGDFQDLFFKLGDKFRYSWTKYLSKKGVQTQVNYRYSLPSQKTFYENNHSNKYKNATLIAKQVLSLPIHQFISSKDMEYILNNLKTAIKKYE